MGPWELGPYDDFLSSLDNNFYAQFDNSFLDQIKLNRPDIFILFLLTYDTIIVGIYCGRKFVK